MTTAPNRNATSAARSATLLAAAPSSLTVATVAAASEAVVRRLATHAEALAIWLVTAPRARSATTVGVIVPLWCAHADAPFRWRSRSRLS